MNRFQHGVIYWHPATGAHEVSGDILGYWSLSGYETGWFGYPTSSPANTNVNEYTQSFQNGVILGSGPGENYSLPRVWSEYYYGRVIPCLSDTRYNQVNNMTLFDGPVGQGKVHLNCRGMRHIQKHFLNGFPSEEEWIAFNECIESTFNNGAPFTPNNEGMWRYRAFAVGVVRFGFTSHVIVDGNQIWTAYTSETLGRNWGKCPALILTS